MLTFSRKENTAQIQAGDNEDINIYWSNRTCPLGNQDNRFIATGVLGRSHVWLHVTNIGKSKSVLKLSLEQQAY